MLKKRRTLIAGLLLTVALVLTGCQVEARGSTERIGQIDFITSDMDPVINMGNLGNRIDFDANNDTSIRASADNTLDIEINGADDFQFTANTFTVAAGSDIVPATGTGVGVVFRAVNTLAYTDTANKTMFVIPANADIVDIIFDLDPKSAGGGTDDTVQCGYTAGDANEYVNDFDADATADILRLGVDAAIPIAANGDVGSSAVTVLCKWVETTGTMTSGGASLEIVYAVD